MTIYRCRENVNLLMIWNFCQFCIYSFGFAITNNLPKLRWSDRKTNQKKLCRLEKIFHDVRAQCTFSRRLPEKIKSRDQNLRLRDVLLMVQQPNKWAKFRLFPHTVINWKHREQSEMSSSCMSCSLSAGADKNTSFPPQRCSPTSL